jgi:hypothetical protein
MEITDSDSKRNSNPKRKILHQQTVEMHGQSLSKDKNKKLF